MNMLRIYFSTQWHDSNCPWALMLSLNDAGDHAPQQIGPRFIKPYDNPAILPSWTLAVPLVQGKTWDWRDAPISLTTPNCLCGDFSPSLRFILLAAFLRWCCQHSSWLACYEFRQRAQTHAAHQRD